MIICPPCALTYTSDQLLGLQRVFALRNSFVGKRIAAINMSLGAGKVSAPCGGHILQPIILLLRQVGIATIISSGNDGFNGFYWSPACIPGAIPVGNTKKDDTLSASSNHSVFVQLLAPGTSISAARAGGVFGAKSGTSMAAPHVAGAFALMRQLKPNASVSSILNALNCRGREISRAGIYRPRIDVFAAGQELLLPDPTESFSFTAPGAVGWRRPLGAWSVSGGKFRSLNFNRWAIASHDYCSSSFRVAASLLRYDPSPAAQRWDSGVIIASSVMQFASDILVSGYAFYFNKGGAGAGNVVVRRLENYDLFSDLGASTQLCSGNKPTAPGVFHTLRVDVTSPGFKFYVDGTLICSFIDFSFPPASVLLAAHGPASGAGHHLLVDSVSITPILTSSLSGVGGPAADFGPRARMAAGAGVSGSVQ